MTAAERWTSEEQFAFRTSELARRQAQLELRFISDCELYSWAEYVYREMRGLLTEADTLTEETPEEVLNGWRLRVHWLMCDLVLVRKEIKRRTDLGQPIMDGKSLSDFAHELKARVELHVFLAGWFSLPLKRVGSAYSCCCPFHTEKTPSFYVYPEDGKGGRYWCYGCGLSGDIFDWVTHDGTTWIEAIKLVARYAGVPMPSMKPRVEREQARQLKRAML